MSRSLRLGIVLGTGCVVATLPAYRSWEHREVLGRWSYPYAAVMAAALVVWIALAVWLARGRGHRRTDAAATIFDMAVLAWGVAYLWTGWSEPSLAARIVDGNVTGSSVPAGAVLEGVSILLLLVWLTAVLWRRRSSAWVNLGVTVWAVVLVLVIGELWCRAGAVLMPRTTGVPSSSSELWYRRYVRVNRDGWRDNNHAVDPTAGEPRLLVIGDSYAFGEGIRDRKDRFGEQLSAALALSSHRTWESLNVSRSDSHTAREMGFLRYGLRYQPDVVVLVYVFNDMDYLAPITPRPALFDSPRGLVGRLSPVRLAYWNSFLFQALYMRARLIAAQWRDPGASDPKSVYDDSALVDRHLRDLRHLSQLARQRGSVFGIIPFDINVVANARDKARYERFVAEARAVGLPVLDISRAFSGYTLSQLRVNMLDGHPNELAARLAAAATAPWLLRLWTARPQP